MIRHLNLLPLSLFVLTSLMGCKEKDYYCSGKDISVVDNNVYIVGYICQRTSETDIPTLWINGESQAVGQMGNFNRATSVFVDGSDIYVTVTEYDQDRAFLWKNGDVQLLGNQSANSVVVNDGNVYVVGQDNNRPTIWTNGTPEPLSYKEGEAKSIFVDGKDIYVVGYTGEYFNGTATLWKNNIEVKMSESISHAEDIVIIGDDIYIVGDENNHATLWLNGNSQYLSYDESYAYSVAVSDNTVFVTGIRGFNYKGSPEYGIWRNGNILDVSEDMRDQIVSVKISNDKVYFSGSSKNMVPLWTINLK